MKLKRENYKNIWFTSDWHIQHDRPFIVDYRGFKTIKEHDEFILDGINNLVDTHDIVFHLGDLFFGTPWDCMDMYRSIKCNAFHCLIGNHDKALNTLIKTGQYGKSVGNYKEIRITKDDVHYPITLSHYPMLAWNKSHYGSWNLCGHSHGSHPASLPSCTIGKRLDVGVDVGISFNNTFMFTFEDVKRIMESKVETEHH